MAALRAAAGISQLDLASLLGWTQSTVSLIESGQRDTLYDVRELLRFADAVDMPRGALAPLILGQSDSWDAQSLAHNVASPATEVDVDRRTFASMAAGFLAAATLPHAEVVPSRVGPSHVRYLRSCAERLYNRDQNVGGAALLRQAIRTFQHARQMLDESSYAESVGRQLFAVTGDLAVCAGWLAFDGGDVNLARRLYSEAHVLAGSANDSILTAHLLTNMSMLSSYVARMSGRRGLAREGLRLAQRAAETARHEPSRRLHALIALREGNAAALLGDDDGFFAAITRARRELDRGPHSDDPEWILFVNESEITGHEAMGRVNLGDPDGGERLYRDVLDAGDLSSRNRAYYGALLADALLRCGAQAEAIEEGLAVLPALAGGVSSIRTLNELRLVRSADGSGAEEFGARFDAVVRSLGA